MGCYPVFSCADWSRLGQDLDTLETDIVSLIVVTDPFGTYSEPQLHEFFPDLVRPFKEHFVVDLREPMKQRVSSHHQRNVRKASGQVLVERCPDPSELAPVWCTLYQELVARHRINGLAAFSRTALTQQLKVPGVVVFRAQGTDATIGMTVWYRVGSFAYYHLGAYSHEGYATGASFAIFNYALRHFAEVGLRWIDLGGAPGLDADGRDGLSRFKRGWATGTRTAYLCGRIFDRTAYAALVTTVGRLKSTYFPAYRSGELHASGPSQRGDVP
jgi:hypothetical protein